MTTASLRKTAPSTLPWSAAVLLLAACGSDSAGPVGDASGAAGTTAGETSMVREGSATVPSSTNGAAVPMEPVARSTDLTGLGTGPTDPMVQPTDPMMAVPSGPISEPAAPMAGSQGPMEPEEPMAEPEEPMAEPEEPMAEPEEPMAEPEEPMAEPDLAPDLPTDAKELLKSLHDNAKFNTYVDEEIGNPVVMATGTGQDMTVDEPIVVPPGMTFDGENRTFTPGRSLGGGSQDENQKPVFILAPGASLVNTIVGRPGAEGVHMMGDNTLDNVHWPDVGEDAASVRSYFPGGEITITNGTANNASDKVFQINAPCDVTIKNFEANNMGKLLRQNGGSSFRLSITVEDVTATGVSDAAIRSDSPNCTVRERNFRVSGQKYKGSCRVSRF